jgi:TonB family protein
MPNRAHILDEPESLGKPFVGSVIFHAAVFGTLFWLSYSYQASRVQWGITNPGGGPGSVAINSVKTIPLPQRSGQLNPLANDSESRIPEEPKPAPQPRAKAPEPDAIPLRSRLPDKPARQDTSQTRYRPQTDYRPNQVYSHEAPALVSPMFEKPGSGQVGVGQNSPLGTLCGAYAAQMQQIVASKWRTNDIDSRLQVAPPVIMTFTLHKNGSIDGLQKKQSSGNYQLDTSAERALLEATPFPPISCESNGGVIEFWFQLKR